MASQETIQGARFPGRTARLLQKFVLERRYGMPSGALRDVDLREIGFDAPERVHDHIPSPLGVLRRILRKHEVTPEDSFIDIGCGMGPVLIEAAARYDFQKVIGIDVVPQFTDVARATATRSRERLRCQEIDVITGDVLGYQLPPDVTVVYMADPFRGRVFDEVVAKLVASVDAMSRPLRLVYHMPVEAARLERTGRARLVRYGRRRNRPWTKGLDLVMYELLPAEDSRLDWHPPRSPRPRPVVGKSGASSGETVVHQPIEIASNDSSSGSIAVSARAVEDLRGLQSTYEHHHCVRLPGLVTGALLDRVQAYVDEGEFSTISHRGIPPELSMTDGKAAQLLLLLVNDPRLFEFVRAVTGCKRIGRFDGNLYRMFAGPEHEQAWRGHVFGHGSVQMSIDLSRHPYSGGTVEIRDRDSREVLERMDSEPGDAILLRAAPFLQHRVTELEGDSVRTVYAGRFWRFRSGGDSTLARLGESG